MLPFLLLLLLLPVASSGPHPDSSSTSSVVVDGAHVAVAIRCQTRSLLEALPIDRDLDGRLDDGELAAARPALVAYLAAHCRMFADASSASAEPLPSVYGDARVAAARAGEREQWILLRLQASAPAPLAELWLQMRLFVEQNPSHLDECSLDWNGREQALWFFPRQGELWHFQPAAVRRPAVCLQFLRLGIEHILTGYDHLAFLGALLLAAARLRAVVGVVTAFTVAHSLTLGAAALGFLRVDPSFVEMAIALSIAW